MCISFLSKCCCIPVDTAEPISILPQRITVISVVPRDLSIVPEGSREFEHSSSLNRIARAIVKVRSVREMSVTPESQMKKTQ